MQSLTVTLIYDAKGQTAVDAARDVARLAKRIQPEWLKATASMSKSSPNCRYSSSMLLRNNQQFREELDALRQQDDGSEMTHSVA